MDNTKIINSSLRTISAATSAASAARMAAWTAGEALASVEPRAAEKATAAAGALAAAVAMMADAEAVVQALKDTSEQSAPPKGNDMSGEENYSEAVPPSAANAP